MRCRTLLSRDERTLEAAAAGASRLIIGNHRHHVRLEAAVANCLGCGGVRLFNSGYRNVGVLTALLGASDVVFSDVGRVASYVVAGVGMTTAVT